MAWLSVIDTGNSGTTYDVVKETSSAPMYYEVTFKYQQEEGNKFIDFLRVTKPKGELECLTYDDSGGLYNSPSLMTYSGTPISKMYNLQMTSIKTEGGKTYLERTDATMLGADFSDKGDKRKFFNEKPPYMTYIYQVFTPHSPNNPQYFFSGYQQRYAYPFKGNLTIGSGCTTMSLISFMIYYRIKRLLLNDYSYGVESFTSASALSSGSFDVYFDTNYWRSNLFDIDDYNISLRPASSTTPTIWTSFFYGKSETTIGGVYYVGVLKEVGYSYYVEKKDEYYLDVDSQSSAIINDFSNTELVYQENCKMGRHYLSVKNDLDLYEKYSGRTSYTSKKFKFMVFVPKWAYNINYLGLRYLTIPDNVEFEPTKEMFYARVAFVDRVDAKKMTKQEFIDNSFLMKPLSGGKVYCNNEKIGNKVAEILGWSLSSIDD